MTDFEMISLIVMIASLVLEAIQFGRDLGVCFKNSLSRNLGLFSAFSRQKPKL